MDTAAGTTTITFADGQTSTSMQVQELVFSDDPTQKLP
jgi:hypothetical protein